MRRHWMVGMLLILPMWARAQNNGAADDPLAKALQQSNVFVGKTLRDQVDQGALERLAQNAAPSRPLKIAVVSELPASGRQFGTRNGYAKALHDWLGLGRGTLIIRTDGGVSAATDAVPATRITQILQQHTFELRGDLVNGIRHTVADLDAAAATQPNGVPSNPNSPAANSPVAPSNGASADMPAGRDFNGTAANSGGVPGFLWLVPVVGIGGLGLWAGKRAMDRGQAMRQARQPLARLHGEVVNGIAYADTYLDLLPSTSEVEQARGARQQAAGLLDQANALTQTARNAEDYARIEALLEQAKQLTQSCHSAIDTATGGTGLAVAVDGTEWRATPAIHDNTPPDQSAPILPNLRAQDIPVNERAACFFCSRPARITDLTPITVAINGQRRKVLACADDVQIIQQGATPKVRSVSSGNGQSVPWYASRGYDPYRDYYRSDVMFVPGYGYGGGMADGFLFGALMAQPYAMPYPVFVGPSGVPTTDFAQSGPPVVADNGFNGGDMSAFDANTNGNDNSSNDVGVGGIDFSGNADAGGAADFGSSGSVDFGSSGSDFGGGGADFSSGGSDFGGGGGGDY